MTDIAQLGLAIDSSPVVKAVSELSKLGPAAAAAGKSVDSLGQAAGRSDTQQRAMEASAKRLGITVAELEARTKATNNTFSEHSTRARMVEQANVAAARAMGGLSGAAGALADGLSRVHPLFGFLGGGALSLTVIIVGLTAAYHQMQEAAMALADRAGKLQDFAETTGFTVIQLQALEKAGAQVGVSANSVSMGLEKFSVAMDDAKKGIGPVYESILEINPALAKQLLTVTSLSDAWDLTSKAIKGADLEQANKLSRALFGRGGVEISRLARSSTDAGGIGGLVNDMNKLDAITQQQAKRWDDLGDTINENTKAARQNIASIFTETVLTGMERFSRGFLELTRTLKDFALGEDFKKFLEWSKSPAGMAILAGGAGAALGMMVGGPIGAIAGGGAGAILGAARGVEYQNRPTTGGTQVEINAGQVDAATTALVAQAKALDDQKRALTASIAEQERINAAMGAAVTPADNLRLGIDKLKLANLENKISAEQAAKGQAVLNAQYSSSQFSTYIGLLGQSASVEEQVKQKRNQMNDAARMGVSLSKEQREVQERLTRENALGITQINAAIDQEKIRAATLRMGKEAAIAYEVAQSQINAMIARGQKPSEDEIKRIREKAAELAKLKVQTDVIADAQKVMRDGFQEVGSAMFSAFLSGKNMMDAMVQSLDNVARKLADKAFENLLEGALSGNPIQMAAGVAQAGASALISVFTGDAKARKKLEEAKKVWADAGPAFETFLSQMSGGVQGQLAQKIDQARQSMQSFADKAWDAEDYGAIVRVQTAFNEFQRQQSKQLQSTFAATMQGLTDGLGQDSPFLKAVENVKTQLNNMQSIIDDARTALAINNDSGINDGVNTATRSGIAFLTSLLQAAPVLTATATSILQLQGTATALQGALVQLGMSSQDAAAVINGGLTKAMQGLAATFTDGLQREINSATGADYKNSAADLVAKFNSNLADAASLGLGSDLVNEWFKVSAQKIVNDAGLAGDALAGLVSQFPQLSGVVFDAAAAVSEAVKRTADDIGAAKLSAQDRLFAAGNDTSTLSGAIAAAERTQARERADEIAKGGQAINDLVAAQQAELAGIYKTFGDKAAEAAVQAAQQAATRLLGYQDRLFASGNDTSTLAGAIAAAERTQQREREAEIAAGGQNIADLVAAQQSELANIYTSFEQKRLDAAKQALDEFQSFVAGFSRKITEYLDGLRAGSSSPLSPQARLTAAQSQYNAQLSSAQGGNRDALNGITQYSTDLIEAAKAFYGSTAGFQSIFSSIQTQLAALPSQVSDTQAVINAIADMKGTLQAAINANSASAVASALYPKFDTLTASTNGLMTLSQFQVVANGLASQSTLAQMFTELDANGDGALSKLELLRGLNADNNAKTDLTNTKVELNNVKAAEANSLLTTTTQLLGTTNQLLNTATQQLTATNQLLTATTQLLGATNSLLTTTTQLLSTTNQLLNTATAQLVTSNQSLNQLYLLTTTALGTNVLLNGISGQLTPILEILQRINANLATQNQAWSGYTPRAPIQSFARGGYVSGPGTGTSDSIHAMLSNGEGILTALTTARLGGASGIDALNAGRIPMMPVPIRAGNDNSGMREMAAELREVRRELAEIKRNTGNTVAVVAASTKEVTDRIDMTNDFHADARKQARRGKAAA